MSYLNIFSIIRPTQSGFRSGHSSKSALTLMAEKKLKAIKVVIITNMGQRQKSA